MDSAAKSRFQVGESLGFSKRKHVRRTSRDLRLGGHISTDNGLNSTVLASRALDYRALQIMLSNGREYNVRHITDKELLDFRTNTYGIDLFVHLPYVINPCESKSARIGFYKRAVSDHCKAASALGAKGVVLHPGYKKTLTVEEAKANIIKFLDQVYQEDWNLKIILETDSGSKNGSAVGSPEFIQDVLDSLNFEHFGMCLDTVHMYARGVDLWDRDIREDFIDEYGHLIDLVHLNSPDPKVTLGSFLDRHNTPFEDRPTWSHEGLFNCMKQWPMILERRSLSVQKQDAVYIKSILERQEDDGQNTD